MAISVVRLEMLLSILFDNILNPKGRPLWAARSLTLIHGGRFIPEAKDFGVFSLNFYKESMWDKIPTWIKICGGTGLLGVEAFAFDKMMGSPLANSISQYFGKEETSVPFTLKKIGDNR
jgi:hypothetical protein